MTLDEFKVWIRKQRFTFAKTYAKTLPHWYTLRKWCNQEEFNAAILCTREHGYSLFKYGSRWTYLEIDGFKYWTGDGPVEKEMVLNREPLPGYDADGL